MMFITNSGGLRFRERWSYAPIDSRVIKIAGSLIMACAILALSSFPCLAQSPPSVPDLLELRPLAARIVASSVQRQSAPDWARNRFLLPVADQVDELAVGEFARRPLALAWVADQISNDVLIRSADWRTLHTRLTELPDAAVERWWQESALLRQLMDDESWQVTEQWLGDFLAVQAIYSADEWQRFQVSLLQLTADEWVEVVDHFQRVHDQRQQRQVISQQMRADAMRANRELRSLPTGARPTSGYVGSGFAGTSPYPARAPRRPGYASRTSLSQRVSQVYIYRSLWGNNFMWWGW